MPTPRYNDRGDTLIEILIAVVLIGVLFSGFVVALATNSTASTTHRNVVTADTVLRTYAEALKQGARACAATPPSGTTFAPSYPPTYDTAVAPQGLMLTDSFAAAGWTVSTTALTCPPTTDVVTPVTITVTKADASLTRKLDVAVRTR